MLSYQHAYHAGNHADILKHYVLCFVIESLNKKNKPYTLFDTHSGSGLYDLEDNRSLKTSEAENGIKKLEKFIKEKNLTVTDTEIFYEYLDLVSLYTSKNYYPGSPEIERQLLRPQDFLILSELHPQEIENLKDNMKKSIITPFKSSFGIEKTSNIQVHKRNGFEMLNALTPPKTVRGAVLIDPSYEETQDYFDVTNCILKINKKWSSGIIMLWYPLLAHRSSEISNMIESITEGVKLQNQNTEILNLNLCVNDVDSHIEKTLEDLRNEKDNPPRLYGSGILVINAPWKLKEQSEQILPIVEKLLRN